LYTDPSPIAGQVVNLQHQVLSRRTLVLNPLKRKKYFLRSMPLKTNLYKEFNENLNTSMLLKNPQETNETQENSEVSI